MATTKSSSAIMLYSCSLLAVGQSLVTNLSIFVGGQRAHGGSLATYQSLGGVCPSQIRFVISDKKLSNG